MRPDLCLLRPRSRPREVRVLAGLHDRARGGVRDPRPADAGAGAPLRGRIAACQRDEVLAESAAGELIASEVEIRSGRAETFAEAVERQRERRARLFDVVAGLGLTLGAMGTHPWADYLDQRIIDTPHYNRLRQELGWVAQRNNTWSLHLHMGIRGADRAIAVCDWLRELLPLLLAVSANSPFLDRRDSGLHSVRSEIFTRTFPRCGVPSPFRDWATYADFIGTLERVGSVVESTQLWWSVRPHHSFGTVEVRICDAQTRGDESLRAGRADRRLHRPDRARLRRARLRRAGGAAGRPRDRGEPLAGDPLRRRRADGRLPARGGGLDPVACSSRCWSGPNRRGRSSGSTCGCRSRTAPSGRARRSMPGPRSRTSTATRWPRRDAPTRAHASERLSDAGGTFRAGRARRRLRL